MVTRSPLACNNLASEAETIPFPNDEVTPPVTNTYLDISLVLVLKKIMCPATYHHSTPVASHSSAFGNSIEQKFSRISQPLFDQRKEINPGGHAKLSGISVIEKI